MFKKLGNELVPDKSPLKKYSEAGRYRFGPKGQPGLDSLHRRW